METFNRVEIRSRPLGLTLIPPHTSWILKFVAYNKAYKANPRLTRVNVAHKLNPGSDGRAWGTRSSRLISRLCLVKNSLCLSWVWGRQ